MSPQMEAVGAGGGPRRALALDVDRNPQLYARLAGAIYLAVIVLGGSAEGLVMNALVVPDDDLATIHAILRRPALWEMGVAANLVVPLIAVVQLWIEYLLLRPAGRNLALLFVFLNLASLSVEAVSKLFQLMVLPLASGGAATADASQAYALASMALLGHGLAFNIALIFFGAACLVIGALIQRSGYLPRFIGVLMQLAGACYLLASFAALLAPPIASALGSIVLLPILVGEATLCLWLLVKGVDVAKWNARRPNPDGGVDRV